MNKNHTMGASISRTTGCHNKARYVCLPVCTSKTHRPATLLCSSSSCHCRPKRTSPRPLRSQHHPTMDDIHIAGDLFVVVLTKLAFGQSGSFFQICWMTEEISTAAVLLKQQRPLLLVCKWREKKNWGESVPLRCMTG
jgi:hypothetical protein